MIRNKSGMKNTRRHTMPNALNAAALTHHRFLLMGDTGSGKTEQFLTLPGKKFMYIFDANSLPTIRGHDVEYEIFLPADLNLDVHSLSKDKSAKQIMGSRKTEVYTDWEKDFDSRDLTKFTWVGFDSITTFLDLIMDYVLTINGRPGQWPNQDDYGPQMVTFTNVMRTLNSQGIGLYTTGHLKFDQDELTKRIYRMPVMTGQLRVKIPLLFSDIFATAHEVDKDNKSLYTIQTKPTRDTPVIRTAIKGLEMYENVTVDESVPIEGQGLGGILAWEQEQIAAAQKGGAKAKQKQK
jgi:hypothetical protein